MKVEIKNFSLFGLKDKQAECEKIVRLAEEFDYVEIELEDSSYATTTLARLSDAVYNDKHYMRASMKDTYRFCKYQIIVVCERDSYKDVDEDFKLIIRVIKSQKYQDYLQKKKKGEDDERIH